MNIIIQTGFEKIIHVIEFQPKTTIKGKQLDQAEHVRNVEEHRSQEQRMIKNLMTDLLDKLERDLITEDCLRCINSIFVFKNNKAIYSATYNLVDELYEFYRRSVVLDKNEII